MIKSLLKLLIPNSKTLAGYAADGIVKGVNGYAADKKEAIAKYATLANEAASLSAELTAMLNDGTIDSTERDRLVELIKPLCDRVLELI